MSVGAQRRGQAVKLLSFAGVEPSLEKLTELRHGLGFLSFLGYSFHFAQEDNMPSYGLNLR